jgi:hypothetical protein
MPRIDMEPVMDTVPAVFIQRCPNCDKNILSISQDTICMFCGCRVGD